jgi:hypothetical protein
VFSTERCADCRTDTQADQAGHPTYGQAVSCGAEEVAAPQTFGRYRACREPRRQPYERTIPECVSSACDALYIRGSQCEVVLAASQEQDRVRHLLHFTFDGPARLIRGEHGFSNY